MRQADTGFFTIPMFKLFLFYLQERYLLSVTDLVCMCVLQAITPAVREAVTAFNRGDKKGVSQSFGSGFVVFFE